MSIKGQVTVGELIEELSKYDKDLYVIVQGDSEGNSYRPLYGSEEVVYMPEDATYGEVYGTDWSAEDCGITDDEWDEILVKNKAVVVYPV